MLRPASELIQESSEKERVAKEKAEAEKAAAAEKNRISRLEYEAQLFENCETFLPKIIEFYESKKCREFEFPTDYRHIDHKTIYLKDIIGADEPDYFFEADSEYGKQIVERLQNAGYKASIVMGKWSYCSYDHDGGPCEPYSYKYKPVLKVSW